ncbi:MAG: hypothetical protein KGJ06_02750 [Pseudomonadota bacterium]|nr:hypothetical protein [Pseudomonadota bacterium]
MRKMLSSLVSVLAIVVLPAFGQEEEMPKLTEAHGKAIGGWGDPTKLTDDAFTRVTVIKNGQKAEIVATTVTGRATGLKIDMGHASGYLGKAGNADLVCVRKAGSGIALYTKCPVVFVPWDVDTMMFGEPVLLDPLEYTDKATKRRSFRYAGSEKDPGYCLIFQNKK